MKHYGWTIVPIGGLANRMRVVMSALEIAPKVSYPIRILWQATDECKASFQELFEPIEYPNITFEEGGGWANKMSTKWNLWIPRLLRKPQYAEQWEDFNPHGGISADVMQNHTSVFVSTCYPLVDYNESLTKRYFIPTSALRQEIATSTQAFGAHTLGVHIRRTDNKMSILHSPVSAFRQRIDKHLADFPDAQVFLCTDDEEVKQQFKDIYGQRLLTWDSELRRNSLKGIQDAVIELWSLSKTSRVVGSYYSSFSNTATEIGEQPLEIIQNNL